MYYLLLLLLLTQIVFNLNTETDLPCFFLTGDLKIKISV